MGLFILCLITGAISEKAEVNSFLYYLSCDYGTVNPFSLGLWGKAEDGWYRLDEYYHSSRDREFSLRMRSITESFYRLLTGGK